MKVYLLICVDSYQDREYEDVVSVHLKRPELPEDMQQPCGCCGKTYHIKEREVLP